jgi:hypothetical protein
MIMGYKHEGSPLDSADSTAVSWTTPQSWAIENIDEGRNEFGVVPAPNAPIWKLAVLVQRENPSLSVRLHEMAVLWRKFRNRGTSFYGATRLSWNTFYPAEADVVVSDPITNTVPTR